MFTAHLEGNNRVAVPPDNDRSAEERYAALLGRRLQEVEGAVAVAFELADRTGGELRAAIQDLATQLEDVATTARKAAATPELTKDLYAFEDRFDEVHRRVDAVTRELRASVASLERRNEQLPAPYGERVAMTLGRRLESVEGEVAVASALVARTGATLQDELADVAAAGEVRRRALANELHAADVRLGEELVALRAEIRRGGHLDAKTDLRLRELVHRIEIVEGDRNAITAELVRNAEQWAAERVALQERVAELAARIVTGPILAGPDASNPDVWPSSRAFDQLRISVEGLRMRLAHHEKSVAELSKEREPVDRADDLQQLLDRLEHAGRAASEHETVIEQLERIAARMDARLEQVEAAASR